MYMIVTYLRGEPVPMRLAEIQNRLARDIEFPADQAAVIDTIGDIDIDAPDGDDESVRDVIERTGERSFSNPDDVYNSILGCVSEQYIGRKYYDDRGHNFVANDRSF